MALIYDNNMASIRNRYPEYADKIEGALDKEYAIESNIAAVVDRSVLYVVKGTRQYQLDSLYENEEMLKIWAKDYTNSALFNVYTIFGFGNGMFVKKLIQSKGRDQDIKIIIYEPDMSIFKTTLLNFDISDIINNENITLYIPELTKTPFGTVLDTVINYKNLNNTYEAVYPNYPLLFPKELESFREAVRINAEAVRSSMDASEKLGNAFYNNLFANMESYINSRSLISLKEKLPNNPPVIVVSSGPSLSKNVAELKNAKGKAFIIAVDSAMPVMLHEGIMPDMYASIDGMKFLAHFEDERTKDIPVLTTSLATPGAIKEGQISFFEQSDDRYLNAFLEEKGIDLPKLSTGGTVANTAFAFAEYLEASAIILCGQDLAYTDDKAHADNALSDNNTISERSLTYTRDINGEEVKTSTEFMLYKDWFEREIATNNVRAIDATEGGARIEGTIIMPLSEAIAGYCVDTIDVAACINDSADLFEGELKDEMREYVKEIPQKLEEVLKEVRQSIDNYQNMLEFVDKNRLEKDKLTKLLRDNDRINKKLDETPVMSIVEYLIQDAIRKMAESANKSSDDAKEEIRNASDTGIEHGKAIIEKAEWIQEDIKSRF